MSPIRPAQRSGHSARHVDGAGWGAGYRALTFPLWVYGAVKIGIPPQVFMLSTLIFVAGLLLAGANWWALAVAVNGPPRLLFAAATHAVAPGHRLAGFAVVLAGLAAVAPGV
ncbi:MAG: hypothetical protein J0H13_10375, partial [Thiomonas arsenitoxydans]|nr:hypothetical protein [Thiomonas arsenitoxydans]